MGEALNLVPKLRMREAIPLLLQAPPCSVNKLNTVTSFSRKIFPHIQTVNTLVHTKDDTAAVTIKASHCYYIITFRKTSKAD